MTANDQALVEDDRRGALAATEDEDGTTAPGEPAVTAATAGPLKRKALLCARRNGLLRASHRAGQPPRQRSGDHKQRKGEQRARRAVSCGMGPGQGRSCVGGAETIAR
jgi:hypothetical protein